MDFARARRNMVEGQLRPNGVVDPRLLEAMQSLPREEFLPPSLRARAYLDEDIPLDAGRWLMEPLVLARLVQAASPSATDRVLVVAAGAGYGAALMGRLAGEVTALETPERVDALRRAIARFAPRTVTAVAGPLSDGWPPNAPYDVILVEGGVASIPEALKSQLAERGRLVAVEGSGRPGVLGRAVRLLRLGSSVTPLPLFEAGTPLLPEFRRSPGFVF